MDSAGWDWFNTHLPVLAVEDSRGIVAKRDGRPVAGFVCDNWTTNSVQCHIVMLDPFILRRGWLETILTAAYGESRQYIYALVPGDNAKSLRFTTRIGFTEKCRLDEGFAPGVDYVIMQMKRADCPYLEENTHG
jgi:hypothetical protein